jgi:alkylmercury lyase-like protein
LSDAELRRRVYRHFAETGEPPEVEPEAARRLGFVVDGDGRILIANPFSGRATDYRVEAGGRYFANCVWDALGILALLGRDGTADCEGIELRVTAGELEPTDTVCHFLVPARHWYDDLVHT